LQQLRFIQASFDEPVSQMKCHVQILHMADFVQFTRAEQKAKLAKSDTSAHADWSP